jgi:hypothetical protein
MSGITRSYISARCSRVVPSGSGGSVLINDLSSTSTASNFIWFTPNGCNDMHDCSVNTGDNYLSNLVPQILTSNIFKTQKAALFITFDEPGNSGSQLYTIWAGPAAKQAYQSSTSYDHYSFLKTIEKNWGLPTLTSNDANATAMTYFLTNNIPNTTTTTITPTNTTTTTTTTTTAAASTGISNTTRTTTITATAIPLSTETTATDVASFSELTPLIPALIVLASLIMVVAMIAVMYRSRRS